MNIITTMRVKTRIREHLEHTYPSITFQFCADIQEARPYLPTAEILLTYGEDITEEDIDQAPNLKWIMVLSAGVDRMPLLKLAEKGILVTNASGIHAIPMAEYAIGMILQVCRQAKTLFENQQSKTWDQRIRITEISGKTMLIVGTGAIGTELARIAKAFGIKTIGVSRSGRTVPHFDENVKNSAILHKIPEADFVISILPSTKETKHYFQAQHFRKMNEHAIFLNMGRGDVVDENALLKALENEEISHAVLDVFEQEPLPENHPFWTMDRVTITPHLSGLSPNYQPRAFEIFEENLNRYLHNQKPFINEIDLNRGY